MLPIMKNMLLVCFCILGSGFLQNAFGQVEDDDMYFTPRDRKKAQGKVEFSEYDLKNNTEDFDKTIEELSKKPVKTSDTYQNDSYSVSTVLDNDLPSKQLPNKEEEVEQKAAQKSSVTNRTNADQLRTQIIDIQPNPQTVQRDRPLAPPKVKNPD